jgi:Cd2+/Zn2+-exporting ATPase
VAHKVGIHDVEAECLPQEKAAYVQRLRQEGSLVAVVGDGVNDGPALAAGDIGIAMGAIGSDVAVQSASIALMNNDLRRIPFLVGLARKTRLLMTQNLGVGFAFIILGLYFSALGYVTPVVAAVLHSAGTLFIIFNSARLVRSGEELHVAEEELEAGVPVPVTTGA